MVTRPLAWAFSPQGKDAGANGTMLMKIWLMTKRLNFWMCSWVLLLMIGCQNTSDVPSPTVTLPSAAATPIPSVTPTSTISLPIATPDFQVLEHSVYRDLLPGLFGDRTIFLINNRIVTFDDDHSDWQYFSERMPTVQPDTWDDFLHSQSRTYAIDALLSSLPGLILVNPEDYYHAFMCGETFCADTEKIRADYPQAFTALITLSRVGFSQDGQQALVWLSVDDGDSIFEDYIVLLTQQGTHWVIEDKAISTWVS